MLSRTPWFNGGGLDHYSACRSRQVRPTGTKLLRLVAMVPILDRGACRPVSLSIRTLEPVERPMNSAGYVSPVGFEHPSASLADGNSGSPALIPTPAFWAPALER
jgi:hypothetical protein